MIMLIPSDAHTQNCAPIPGPRERGEDSQAGFPETADGDAAVALISACGAAAQAQRNRRLVRAASLCIGEFIIFTFQKVVNQIFSSRAQAVDLAVHGRHP